MQQVLGGGVPTLAVVGTYLGQGVPTLAGGVYKQTPVKTVPCPHPSDAGGQYHLIYSEFSYVIVGYVLIF